MSEAGATLPTGAFVRFLLSGGFNTAVTYVLYLVLLQAMPYWAAYSITYVLGIGLAYYLSRRFVFNRPHRGNRVFAFPAIYVLQYAIGLALTVLWVRVLDLPATLAPVAALVVTVPVTYVLTRWVFAVDSVLQPPRVTVRSSWMGLGVPLLAIGAATVALLWIPFGLTLGGLLEEWDVLGLFVRHGLFFVIQPDGPMGAHSLRPLTILPQALAYLLDPDSFNAWHLLNAGLLVLKSVAVGWLATRATRSHRWGLVAGVLALVFPADTMQFAFRGLHINAALALVLTGAALVIEAHLAASRRTAAVMATGGMCAYLAAGLMYETSLALLALPWAVLVAALGLPGAWAAVRARPMVSAAWLAAPASAVGYALVLHAAGAQSYQESVVGPGLLSTLIGNAPKLFTIGLPRALLGGWIDAAGIVRHEFAARGYLLAATGALLALLAWLANRAPAPQPWLGGPAPRWHLLHVGAAGLLLLACGYAPYLASGAHLVITQRTYLFATPGAVLVTLAVLAGLWRMAHIVSGALLALLVLLGLGAQLYQFHHYIGISDLQRSLLREIVEAAGPDLDGRTLLVLDGSNRLNHTWMLRGNLHEALTYVTDHPVTEVEICAQPSGAWERLDGLGRPGRCVETPHGWELQPAMPVSGPGLQPTAALDPARLLAAADTVVVRLEADGTARKDPALARYRDELAHGNTPAARRYRGILTLPPEPPRAQAQFVHGPAATYRWDFGRWWSLEAPIHGTGWREAEWTPNGLTADAAAWSISPEATLYFDMAPATAVPYVLEGDITLFAGDAVRAGLQLVVNGRRVAYRWEDTGHFVAKLGPGVIVAGQNVVEFRAPTLQNYYGLSAKLSWFEVRPDPAPSSAASTSHSIQATKQ